MCCSFGCAVHYGGYSTSGSAVGEVQRESVGTSYWPLASLTGRNGLARVVAGRGAA